jgi:hypothetical protein
MALTFEAWSDVRFNIFESDLVACAARCSGDFLVNCAIAARFSPEINRMSKDSFFIKYFLSVELVRLKNSI